MLVCVRVCVCLFVYVCEYPLTQIDAITKVPAKTQITKLPTALLPQIAKHWLQADDLPVVSKVVMR